MLSRIDLNTRAGRTARPASRRATRPLGALCVVAATAALFCALSVGAGAQGVVPETLRLRPGYVGVRYELVLSDLLPKGAPKVSWSLVCGATAVDQTMLECPRGLSLEQGQKLVVAPVAADLLTDPNDAGKGNRTKPYTFEVSGQDGPGVQVRMRFVLQVKPLGVDDSRFAPRAANNPAAPDQDDELRTTVVGYSPSRPLPKPPPPTPTPSPFVLVKSTADEETLALTERFEGEFQPADVILNDTSNRANFYIKDSDVVPLVRNTIGTDATARFENGDYLVVHVVKWKALKENKSDPERQLWALFEKIDRRRIDGHDYEWLPRFAASEKGTIQEKRLYDTRIYGSKRVFVLSIHLNTPGTWDIKYKMNVSQQVPTPVQNALQLAAFVGGAGAQDAAAAPESKDIWGARLMLVRYRASDMLVQVNAVTPDSDFQIREQNKDYAKKYDNEGRYWWDVSVGLPANSIKELEYTVDATGQNSVVSVRKKERQNAFGFLNIFPRPVDLEANSFLTKPHLVLGVPISGKPLDRPIVALGSGVYRDLFKINFFAGVAFNKVREPRTLQVGDPATEGQLETDIRTRREPKFVFGINFPVRQFLEAIRGSDNK